MLRRRVLLQNNLVVTFQDFVETMVALGCPTGTDENGFYVQPFGAYVNNRTFFDYDWDESKAYVIGWRGWSAQHTMNLRVLYTQGNFNWLYLDLTEEMTDKTLICRNGNNLDNIYGIWWGGSPKVYDFYIKEYTEE